MEIRKYIQGNDDKEIFSNIGAWLTSIDVQKTLGSPITSKNEDIWYIAFLNSITIGFSVVREIKSTNSIHIKYVHADDTTKKALLKKIINEAKNINIKSLWTNERANIVYDDLGFVFTKRDRGVFGKYELIIKN